MSDSQIRRSGSSWFCFIAALILSNVQFYTRPLISADVKFTVFFAKDSKNESNVS